MIRRSMAALLALSLTASANGWRYWTWPGEARMAAASGRTAWFATSGGVFEWDLDANTSKLHQRSDGLPSTNLVSIATQKDGSVWTVSANGYLAVKRPWSSSWESRGTYSAQPSPWSFTPRAMVMHRNAKTGREVLVMGGAKGLTFFPTDSGTTLDWTDQFGTIGKREVRSILMLDDTLWVGLMGGLVRVTPPWDSLGNNRAFISDPRRWTVLASTQVTDDYCALFPANGSVTWQPTALFGAPNILLSNAILYWRGTPYVDTPTPDAYGNLKILPTHALEFGNDLLVASTSYAEFNGWSRGPLLIQKDGSFRFPVLPANAFPAPPPPTAILEPGMHVTAWSSKHVYAWSPRQTSWSSPWTGMFWDSIDLRHNFDLVNNIDMNTFVRARNGSVWAGTWGKGLWAALPDPDRPDDTLSWRRWSIDNSCLEETAPAYPGYVTINALTATDSAVWGVTYREAADSATIFSASLDGKSMRCWKYPSPNSNNSGIAVDDKRLWIATHAGLFVFERPKPSSRTAKLLYTRNGDFGRVLPYTYGDKQYMIATTYNSVSLIPVDATKDTVIVNSATQESPVTARQKWRSVAIDGLGQIWLTGDQGLDVLALVETEDGLAFQSVQEVTEKDGLPSNMVYNISIDASSGTVLVATDKGLGAWSSPYRPLPTSLNSKKARVYPNPLRTRTHKELVVDGATTSSHFYLHAADGSLVVHLPPEDQSGGYFRWAIPGPMSLRPGVYRWTLKDGSSKVGGPLLIAE